MPASSRASGFTLLEITIATCLLTVIALGSAQLFVVAIRHNVTAKQQLMLGLAAARKADEMCAAAAAGPVALSPPDALDRDAAGFADVAVDGGITCARRWLVYAPPVYAGAALVVVVRARVAGTGPSGPLSRVQIVTVCEAALS